MNTTQPRAELVRAINAYVRLRRGELPLRDELVYLDGRRPIVVEDDLPFEFDPQHSSCYGSERSRCDAVDWFGLAVVGVCGTLSLAVWWAVVRCLAMMFKHLVGW